jgi:hypothetical protein
MFNEDKVETKKDIRKSVFGIYESKMAVDRAVDQLKAQGFRNSDISVLMPSKEGTAQFAHEKETKAPEGATTGAATGAVLGGGLGWLVGLGALAIPGIGPFVAAGPIMSALAGAGIGGTVGGIAGALIGMGIPEYEAKRYEGFVKEGGILLSVHVDDSEWQSKAKSLLESTGARDVATSGEVVGEGGHRGEHVKDESFRDLNSGVSPLTHSGLTADRDVGNDRDGNLTGTYGAGFNAGAPTGPGLRTNSDQIAGETDTNTYSADPYKRSGM